MSSNVKFSSMNKHMIPVTDEQWYLLYTRPRFEKKVVASLTKRDFENYCPQHVVAGQWSDRKKVIYNPLFSSYVFVRIPTARLKELLKIEGVINVVYWLGKPAAIPEKEIDMIRLFLSRYHQVNLTRSPVNALEKARIVTGEAKNEYAAGESVYQIRLILPTLGYSLVAETAKNNVIVINASKTVSVLAETIA